MKNHSNLFSYFRNNRNFSKFNNLVLTTPFVFIFFRSYNSQQSSLTIEKIRELLSINTSNNQFFSFLIINFLTILSPIVLITFLEIFINIKSKNGFDLSITKINNAGGGRLADLWHFLFFLVEEEFPFIISVSTIGLASISSSFNEVLTNLFSNFIVSPASEFSALILLVISFLIVDLLNYIEHRLQHKISLIWDMHELHHSATKMTIFSNFRKTPFEGFLLFPVTVYFYVLTTLSIIECSSKGYSSVMVLYIVFNTLKVATMYLSHSSLKIIYPKPLSFFLMSPSLHWIHHSDNPRHYDSNFGMVFPFWDILFKSYMGVEELENINAYGVKNSIYNKYNPFYSHYLIPINKILKRFKTIIN